MNTHFELKLLVLSLITVYSMAHAEEAATSTQSLKEVQVTSKRATKEK